jgi:hypothetical protein
MKAIISGNIQTVEELFKHDTVIDLEAKDSVSNPLCIIGTIHCC